MATSKLDQLLREAEEMLAVKLTVGQQAAELRDATTWFGQWKKEWSKIQPEVRSLRQALERSAAALGPEVARLMEFCDWNLAHIRTLETRLESLAKTAQQDHHDISRLIGDLLDDSKKLLMMPCATMLHMLPRLVRDLCRDQGKEAEVVLRGADAEMDKRILEEMKDPLVHLVRNCVDHGLEPSEQRSRQGKSPRGKITVAIAEVEGNKIEIAVTDDGAGIDPAKVRESAVRCGAISADAARQLNDDASLALIFQSEVSTSNKVSPISGRGLGLAIVREKVEKLGGRISLENRLGHGTAFRILLPLTLATFRGILVEADGQTFVIPTANVARVARIKADDIRTVENRETISLNGRALSFARLGNVLELAPSRNRPDTVVALVLAAADQQIAFAVDAVLNEAEVLVKPLQAPLARVRNVAGATILGTGKVVPVLNAVDLLKSAAKIQAPARPAVVAVEKKRKTILVVEDSITSRMLLKNILESAGYRVKTAVDGIEALTALKTEDFDAVVSDIQMPRLDGFALTEKIRSDKKLTDMPVVLVTALETAADREHGVDVGANAYIVKSSFDQSDLLATIERLV
jgi:two-component system chemotaxis sensor kinase CheA